VLHAMKCVTCGVVLFPPQRFGCVSCGAAPEQLRPIAIPAMGRIHSFAVVHRHPSHPTPYTIAEIELATGLLVRGLVAEGTPLHRALRVAGKAQPVGGGAQLVFGAEEGESS